VGLVGVLGPVARRRRRLLDRDEATGRDHDVREPAASRTPTTANTPPAAATTAATSKPTTAAPTKAKEPTTAATRTPAPVAGVPDGFFLHRDPTGFAVAVPEGWDERREGNRVWFYGPNGDFLQIDQTDSPKGDPEADWRSQERTVSQRVPGYSLLGIDTWSTTTGRPPTGSPPRRSTGAKLHVRNRGFVTDRDERGYALYWSTPWDRWDSSLDHVRRHRRLLRAGQGRPQRQEGRRGGDDD
jgi:hypothetical protein